jgi:hypothetical protein
MLFFSAYSFVKDVLYFSSRMETTAEIVSVENLGSQKPYRVLVKYFNRYSGQDISCEVLLKKSSKVTIDKLSNGYANIYYHKYMPCAIYFVEFNTPTLGVFFMDGVLIVVMSFSVWASKDDLREFKKLKN